MRVESHLESRVESNSESRIRSSAPTAASVPLSIRTSLNHPANRVIKRIASPLTTAVSPLKGEGDRESGELKIKNFQFSIFNFGGAGRSVILLLSVLLAAFRATTAGAQTIQFLNAAPSVYENGTNVAVIVTRTPASGVATIDYTTVDDTALAGADYQFTSGTLTFNDGESFQIITIPIINDNVPEGTEDFFVVLSNPTGALLGLATNTVTIFDDDTILRIGSTSYTVNEDATNIVVPVIRTGGTAGSVSVDYFTQSAPGTNAALLATANIDYDSTFGTLVFVDGQITNYITIPITDDCLVESNETFQLVLNNPIGATIGNPGGQADITIIDNDTINGFLAFSFVSCNNGLCLGTNVFESVGTIIVHVDRLCGTNGAISVKYRDLNPFNGICPGTMVALTNQDYVINGTGQLDWADGDATTKTFTITILDDNLLELDETIILELFNPGGGARIKTGASRIPVRILFDEQPPGAADQTYNFQTVLNPTPGANNTVYASAVYTDSNDSNFGKNIIAGDFSAYNANPQFHGIARVTATGAADTSFNPGSGADGFVNSVIIQPLSQGQSKILIAGGFSSINNQSRNGIARLNPNGSLDSTFNPGSGTDGPVLTMALQGDGKIIIGGEFTTVNNVPHTRIARLNADGSVDNTFLPSGSGASDTVYAVAVQTDGKILLGGLFLTVNGTSQSSIARLNSDGSIDQTFVPVSGADSAVFALALQNDGAILAGGAFSTYDGVSRASIARLNQDGTLDTTFGSCAGGVGPIYDVKIQPNGSILIAGEFSSYNGTPRTNIARLYLDGTLDTGFLDAYYNQTQPGPNQFISTMSLQTDGNIIIGGGFNKIGGGATAVAVLPRFNTARLIGGDPLPALNLAGNVQFVSATYNVDEFAGFLAVTVSRINGELGPVAVDWATSDDTALAGTHYGIPGSTTPPSGTLSWSACDTSTRIFNVPIIDNTIVDGNHNFKITLSNPHSTAVGTNGVAQPALGFQCTAVATIVDNDVNRGVLGFSAPIYTVNENGGIATITVTRTNGSTDAVHVQYATSNGTATAPGDYATATGTLNFLSGETNKTFTITINDDLAKEPEETVNLRLSNVSGGATLGLTNATLLIFDNDNGNGSISFTAQSFSQTEGSAMNATNYANITVRRTSGSVGTVAVDAYTVELPLGPGIARAGIDYIPVTNHLVFPPGVVATNFLVPIIPDRLVEGDEILGLALTNVTVGTIGFLANATLTIVDDDFYGSLSFSDLTYYFSEKASNAVITVVRTGGSAEQVSVDYFTADGTATNGLDYTGVTNTLVFPDGVTVQTFSVPIIDDTELEFDETVSLVLTNFSKAGPGAIPNSTLVINDDEALNVPAGSLDTLFSPAPGPDGFVNAVAVQTNGTILIAGAFSSYNGVSRNRIARVRPDATLDLTFNPRTGANGTIHAMALQPDQKVIVGGEFTVIASTNRNYIARFNQNGGVDTTFNPGAGADNPIYAVAVQSDGKVLIGGDFSTFNGVPRSGIARLNSNGTLDSNFRPGNGANGTVRAIVVQSDGRILLGGSFIQVNNQTLSGVARLNPDGSVDSGFDPGEGADGEVRCIAVQSDGGILLGGAFNNFDGTPRNYVVRLSSAGALDSGFDPGTGADNSVSAMVVQSNGKIVVTGDFTSYNGITARRIARLNSDGSIDPSINFGTGANDFIDAIALQRNEEMVIGGGFTSFNETPRQYLARLVGGINLGSGVFQYSAPAYTINENQTNITITVLRLGGLAGPVTVDYSTSDGTATAGLDYTNVRGTLSFPEGETRRSFVVSLIDDTEIEPDESVILNLANPTGTAELAAPPNAVLTIVSDDCMLGFSSASYSVNENVIGSNAVITVVRTGSTIGTVMVDFSTVPGTATPGADYVTNSGTLIFGPGETNKTFTITIIDDNIQEGNETVTNILSHPRGPAVLGLAASTLTIVDNDFRPGVIVFSAPSYAVAENGSNVIVTLLRTNGALGVVSVQFTTGGGTATPGLDYMPQGGTVLFGNNQTTQTLVIPIIDDTLVEGDETFGVTIYNPSGGVTIAGPTNVTVTIVDNEFRPGSVGSGFDPGAGANNYVRSLAVQPDGRIIIGGVFTNFANTNRNYIARLNTNGSLDLTFNPGVGASAPVSSVAVSPDSKVLLGGAFTNVNGAAFNRVARLNTNGTPDANFNQGPVFDAAVNVIAAYANGRVVAGGGFTLPAHSLIRLRLDATVDTSFTLGAGANGPVHCEAVQTNGQVLIGGAFTAWNGAPLTRVARLNSDGTLDQNFSPNAITNGTVYSVAAQPDGKVVLGGDFFTTAKTNRVGLARLNPDGSLDTSFNPGKGANGTVFALGLNSQGKVIIAGNFTTVNSTNRNRLARLNADGSLDLAFNPGSGANNTVYTLAVMPDDNIIIGGDFTAVDGLTRNRVARIEANDTGLKIMGVAFVSGQVQLTNAARAGISYTLQSSSDLSTWTDVVTNSASGPTLILTDPNPNNSRQFYRVRQGP